MLVGVKLSGMEMNTVNLMMGELTDCAIQFGGSTFINSKLESIKGHTNGSMTAVGTSFKNISSSINTPGVMILRDCTLTDVSWHIGYWTKPTRIKFINCKITNAKDPLVVSPAYSIGKFEFENCELNLGDQPMIRIYDLRKQPTDHLPGIIQISQCKIKTTAKSLIELPDGNRDNEKMITIKDNGNTYDGSLIIGLPGPWFVESDSKTGVSHLNKKVKNKDKDKDKKHGRKDKKKRK